MCFPKHCDLVLPVWKLYISRIIINLRMKSHLSPFSFRMSAFVSELFQHTEIFIPVFSFTFCYFGQASLSCLSRLGSFSLFGPIFNLTFHKKSFHNHSDSSWLSFVLTPHSNTWHFLSVSRGGVYASWQRRSRKGGRTFDMFEPMDPDLSTGSITLVMGPNGEGDSCQIAISYFHILKKSFDHTTWHVGS